MNPECACEQSTYWTTYFGVNCPALNVIYCSSNAEIPYLALAESREYHPDYLGSVEFVTDMRGEPYQVFLNTPWGENIENQFARKYTVFFSRFRFNGKEWEGRALRIRPVAYFSEGARLPRGRRDWETDNYYYGARYYDPEISVWLSVDPLAGKFPSLSPYAFVANNPINLVDPDGRDIWEIDGKGNIVSHTVDKTQDAFYRVDNDGNRIEGESISFEYGTITAQRNPMVNIEQKDGSTESR